MALVSDVFDRAMGLMDELDADGNAQTTDTTEYQKRTPAIVNIMTAEYMVKTGARGKMSYVTEMGSYISGIDDLYATAIMPYGLAANLLVDENPTAAQFYQSRYEELQAEHIRRTPSTFEPIEDVYGGLGNSDYGTRW